ncbi:MAG: phasin family protein [Parvularculaceae bacterium]
MAEQKRKGAGTVREADGERVRPEAETAELTRFSERNVEFMSRAARACLASATEINRELVAFLNLRMKKDFEAASLLMRTRKAADALSAQASFFEEAVRDYAEETSRLFDIAARAAREALKPLDR